LERERERAKRTIGIWEANLSPIISSKLRCSKVVPKSLHIKLEKTPRIKGKKRERMFRGEDLKSSRGKCMKPPQNKHVNEFNYKLERLLQDLRLFTLMRISKF